MSAQAETIAPPSTLTHEEVRAALEAIVATADGLAEQRDGARADVVSGVVHLWTLARCQGVISNEGTVVTRIEAHELAGQVAAAIEGPGCSWTERRLIRSAMDHLRHGLVGLGGAR